MPPPFGFTSPATPPRKTCRLAEFGVLQATGGLPTRTPRSPRHRHFVPGDPGLRERAVQPADCRAAQLRGRRPRRSRGSGPRGSRPISGRLLLLLDEHRRDRRRSGSEFPAVTVPRGRAAARRHLLDASGALLVDGLNCAPIVVPPGRRPPCHVEVDRDVSLSKAPSSIARRARNATRANPVPAPARIAPTWRRSPRRRSPSERFNRFEPVVRQSDPFVGAPSLRATLISTAARDDEVRAGPPDRGRARVEVRLHRTSRTAGPVVAANRTGHPAVSATLGGGA